MADEISSAIDNTCSLSANAAPPAPKEANISTIVLSTCSSSASSPHIASRITSENEVLPVAIAGNEAAKDPATSSALQRASPIRPQIFTINFIIILIINCCNINLIAQKRYFIISLRDGIQPYGFDNLGKVRS